MLKIKILGPGCPNCHKVEENARSAATNMGIQADFEKISDYAEIQKYRILGTPGLVINEKVVCAGRIPDESEIMTWLADAQLEAA
jgi:small redox-active disulfide protein 2